jgi:hypothetical protein
MKILVAAIILVCSAPRAPAGTVVTRDGQTHTGEVTLAGEQIRLKPKDGKSKTFALKDIARADFAQDKSAAPAAAPKPDKSAEGPARIFVEYFADREMTDRRLARFENAYRRAWQSRQPIDPSIPDKRATVRMTARLMPLATANHKFSVDFYGGVRLYVDDQLKLDHWAGKGEKSASCTVPLTANKPVTIRAEVSGESIFRFNLIVDPGFGGQRVITPDMLLPLDDVPAPAVTAKTPGDATHFRAPPSITIDTTVTPPAGRKIARVELVTATAVLAAATAATAATAAPYRIEWKEPAPGVYKVRARATDDHGVSGYGEPLDVSVAGVGKGQSLPAPWGDLTLGKRETLIPGMAAFADGTFTITKAGGQITEADDAPHFVYQPVAGDFQLVARVASVSPQDQFVGPLAGLMVRENMTSLDRFLAVAVGPDSTTVVRRTEYWGRTEVGERAEAAAAWIKIARVDKRLRAYTSPDGVAWSLLGNERLSLPDRVYVGLYAMARSKDVPAVAAFDNVKLTAGSPALAHRAEGILFKNGTFLAAEVAGVKNGKVAYTRNGERKYLPDSDVARLVYKPVSAEIAEKAPADQTGLLMASGDFIDGEIKEISYLVILSNVVFGRRTINLRTNDVLAIYLSQAQPPALPYVLTTTDGSVYQTKAVKADGDTIDFEDPTLGPIEIPKKEIAQLKVNS